MSNHTDVSASRVIRTAAVEVWLTVGARNVRKTEAGVFVKFDVTEQWPSVYHSSVAAIKAGKLVFMALFRVLELWF